MFDTGISAGEMTGRSQILNAVSIRRQRPLRAAIGSDGFKVDFYHGKSKCTSNAKLGSEGQ